MADEFLALGLDYTDESEVRAQVAATIEAKTSTQSLAEEEKVRKAWKALDQAEKEYTELETTLVNDGVSEARRDYLLQQKYATVEKAAQTLEKAQVEAEEAAERRLRGILAKKQDLEKKENAIKRQDSQGVKVEGSQPVKLLARQVKDEEALPYEDQLPRPDRMPGGSVNGPGVVFPRADGRAAGRVNPAHVRGAGALTDAVQEYQGGRVLHSANQVMASSREAVKKRTFDDGDRSHWEARKRNRDDEIVAEDEENGGAENRFVQFSPQIRMPKIIWERLFDYQQQAITWMLNLHNKKVGGILGDEMGLGKTIQVASFLNLLNASQMLKGPVLIVAPLTVLNQWVGELQKWCPDMRAIIFHSSGTTQSNKEKLIRDDIQNKQDTIVITTYQGMARNVGLLQRANFDYIVLDEGHKICNPAAAVTVAAKTFTTPHRIILSGSPIQNSLKELWCLFDFVVPSLLGNLNNFVSTFEDPIKASRNPKATQLELATAVECAKSLRTHIAPFLLRRLKKDVNTMLPPKNERVIRCTLTDKQLEKYCTMLCSPEIQNLLGRPAQMRMDIGNVDRNGRMANGGLISNIRGRFMTEGLSHQAFKMMSQLRLLSNHVDLHNVRTEDAAEGGSGKHISFRSNNKVDLEGSGKLIALAKMLKQWKENGHKVLVFSQFRMMLDIIENLVEQEGYKYIRMDGTTAGKDRSVLIETFNSDPSVFVACMTTKVGGLGVNLVGADRVVIFDPDWNPVTDEQARERAWRIGQTREVCVYRMITAGTVEEHILHRQLAKNYVTDKVLKDPTVQRFYSMNSFVDHFMLGSEYSERVPANIRHSIVAASIRGAHMGHEVEATMAQETLATQDLEGDEDLDLGEGSSGAVAVKVEDEEPQNMRRNGTARGSTSAQMVQVKTEPNAPSGSLANDDGSFASLMERAESGATAATGRQQPRRTGSAQGDALLNSLARATAKKTLQRAVTKE